jgi:8-oxo-dGTP pyrophosphatase MutT (NUDIX family)
MNFAHKACPVVFRDASMRQILAFEHPEAGLQLVKGRIEAGEDARAAALRELQEESGIAHTQTQIAEDLGTWQSGHKGHVWSFHLCTFAPTLPERWTHLCEDDGGHEFKFFWHDVNQEADEKWSPQYRRALQAIRDRTRALRWRG